MPWDARAGQRWLCGCAIVFILASGFASPSLAGGIARASDLAREARNAARAGVPLVVFFSQPDCEYCERARHDYLEPLLGERSSRVRLRLVEVNIRDAAPVVDFAGRSVTRVEFTRAEHVRLFPTLGFYGASGHPVAAPLVGLTLPDYYAQYLERRVEQARERLRAESLSASPPSRAARATAGG